MLNKLRRAIQPFFSLSKSQQRGTLALVILVLLAAAVYYLLPYLFKPDNSDFKEFEQEIAAFRNAQQQIRDSIYIERLQNTGKIDSALAAQKIKPFPFNPNKLPVETWKKLGLTDKQIKTIKNYEAKGGQFRRKKDLKKMYVISEIEYELLEPYIRIPSHFVAKTEKQTANEKNRKAYFAVVEINKADSSLLVEDLKLATWLAARVVKYRDLLGGFYEKQQLTEVYGFDSIALAKRKQAIRVDATFIQKLDLNNASFKQLVRHPYISYELTKYIVNTRQAKGGFNSVQELKGTPLVSESLFDKLSPYLVVGKQGM